MADCDLRNSTLASKAILDPTPLSKWNTHRFGPLTVLIFTFFILKKSVPLYFQPNSTQAKKIQEIVTECKFEYFVKYSPLPVLLVAQV